jgi:hypothetical protein
VNNKRIALILTTAIALLFSTQAWALCDARWFTAVWNCKIAKRPMTIKFFYDGERECSVSVKATNAYNSTVNMSLRAASASEVTFADEGGSVFVLRPKPAGSRDYSEGTATIENIADPLVCAKHPLKPDRRQQFLQPARVRTNNDAFIKPHP